MQVLSFRQFWPEPPTIRVKFAFLEVFWNFETSVQGDNWEGICAEGQSQSPINIISEKAKSKYDWDIFRPTNYSRETTWDVQFDGGVKMVPRDAGIMLAGGHLVGDELNENQFVLAQAHFHWGDDDQAGSEHTLNGKQVFSEFYFLKVLFQTNLALCRNPLCTLQRQVRVTWNRLYRIRRLSRSRFLH